MGERALVDREVYREEMKNNKVDVSRGRRKNFVSRRQTRNIYFFFLLRLRRKKNTPEEINDDTAVVLLCVYIYISLRGVIYLVRVLSMQICGTEQLVYVFCTHV